MNRIEIMRRVMSKLTLNVSNDESFCCAPSSDSEPSQDRATDDVSEQNDDESDNDFIDWIIFGGNKENVNE